MSTIIGYEPYRFVVDEFHIPCVIGGFEPLDVLMAVFMLKKLGDKAENVIGQIGVNITYAKAKDSARRQNTPAVFVYS